VSIPNLQIALDNSSLESALQTIRDTGDVVDIIEVGTILCLSEGVQPIKSMKALFPQKTIVADTKCADAGKTVAENAKNSGADWMTVICSATIPTMKAAKQAIDELQVELYGNWSYEQAQNWLDIGINQVVYHQSRDALLSGEGWGKKDINTIKNLINMGFKVSVTGGIKLETLEMFKDLNVFTFIAGRSITETNNPYESAKKFKNEIKRIWS